MAFIPELETPRGTPPSKQDYEWATYLHDIVVAYGRRRTAWSHKKWAKEFRLLRSSITSPDAMTRINRVMQWFLKHIGKEYTPVVFSAKAFRSKFEQMEAAAKRQDQLALKVGKEAKALAEKLGQMNPWPVGCKEHLPQVVQVSWSNARKFRNKIRNFRLRLKKLKYASRIVMEGFVDRVEARTIIGGLESFVQHWLERVSDTLTRWEGWSGKLISWAFREDSREFERMGLGWAYEYGDPRLWEQFKEAINGKSKTI